MKPVLSLAAVAAAALALVVAPANAANGHPHFIKNASSATLSGANLNCNFKEAGLASGSVETITCNAQESVAYECVNGGGKNPAASNKRTFQTTASKTGTFTADKNGNVVGTLTLSPASAQSLGFSCPPGQTVTFVSVTYSNVSIVDSTSGASIALPGTFSFTNPSAPPFRG
jgi:hypothetical protein